MLHKWKISRVTSLTSYIYGWLGRAASQSGVRLWKILKLESDRVLPAWKIYAGI